MARNEGLEMKVREALAGFPNVEEKQMFRGTAFMVNGKLCISAGDDELLFRIDPKLHDDVLEKEGCREMLRNDKPIKGYVYVHESKLQSEKELDQWLSLALDFNKAAKATKKKTRS